MKMLIIGANGFLGGHLVRSRDPRYELIGPSRAACDITNQESLRETFASTRPDVAILCAALADIDRCENYPDLARAINVEGAKNVAAECARHGVRMMFTSSGAVFDGTAESYRECDAPSPLSVYGKTKAEAEQVIREMVPDAVIMRLSLVIGFAPRSGTNAMLDKLQTALKQGSPVRAPSDEYRNAIDVSTLTQWILDLAPKASGTFHLGSSDAISRYELVCKLAIAMGYSSDLIVPADNSPYRAPRGRRHMLIAEKIQQWSDVAIPSSTQTILGALTARQGNANDLTQSHSRT